MSYEYDEYLKTHAKNVSNAFGWLMENVSDILTDIDRSAGWNVFTHDQSKYITDEYEAYDAYFYGGNRSYKVVSAYNKAWLKHIHRNPHHWQHWVLIHDEVDDAKKFEALDIPVEYVVEMIADWWSFSWTKGDLYEIFDWFEKNEPGMILSTRTSNLVHLILKKMREKLDEEKAAEESNTD